MRIVNKRQFSAVIIQNGLLHVSDFVDITITLWMEKVSGSVSEQQLVSHRCLSTPEGNRYLPGNFYLPMSDWQATHVLPDRMVLAVHYWLWVKTEKDIDRVTMAMGFVGIFFAFIWHKWKKHLESVKKIQKTLRMSFFCWIKLPVRHSNQLNER